MVPSTAGSVIGKDNSIICNICNYEARFFTKGQILKQYEVKYYKCARCEFLKTEKPYWLEEAYREPINISDTGILYRNNMLCEIISKVIYYLFDKDKKFLDYAGGYGIFTRLMRDIGFDFFWHDLYSNNIFARGFEYKKNMKNFEVLTTFESFEHFVDPIKEINSMLGISKNIIFTTALLPEPVPDINDWWYYGLEHGQHISFYSLKTLQYLAANYGLKLYSNGINIHLFTSRNIDENLFGKLTSQKRFGLKDIPLFIKNERIPSIRHSIKYLIKRKRNILFNHVKDNMESRISGDMNDIIIDLKNLSVDCGISKD